MTKRHLTNEQIQDWLDGNLSPQSSVAQHLEDCPQCEAEVATFQELFRELNQPPDFSLSSEFAANVTQQIEAGDYRFSTQLWYWIMIIGGFMLGIAINVYYLGTETILAGLAKIGDAFVNFLISFESVKNAATSLNINQNLILVAAIVLVCTFLLDRFVFQHRSSF